MAKNAFATIGILAVLLLSLGLVSAVSEGFNLTTIGLGDSALNPVNGANGTVHTVTVSLNHTNTTFGDVQLNWSGANALTLPANGIVSTGVTPYTLTIQLPPATQESYRILTATFYNQSNLSQELGSTTTNIYYNGTEPTTSEEPENTLCELEGFAENGDLEISDFDVVNNGAGSDDEWQYLDDLEIIVEIGNTDKDNNLEDIEVMIAIFDNSIEEGGIDVTSDFDIDDEILTSIGRLKDQDEETVTFIIDELSADVDEGTYYMYIMAYSDGNEEEQCSSVSSKLNEDFYFEFLVEAVDYDESIVARGTGFENQIDAYCGQENLEITVPVYNLGDGDEERVLVNLRDTGLGVNEYVVLKDLDSGDKESVSFFINIPSDLSRETYDLDVYVYFDWDDEEDDDDLTSYDEQTSDASVRLNILGCTGADPTISASLESAAKVGEELVILATITNNGKDENFDITISGYESWAELVSISPDSLSLDEDEERTVTIRLIPTKEGIQTFDINTLFNEESYNQAVSVNISEEKGLFADVNKTVFYSAIGIAVLLVLIFLTLIVKVSRRSKKVPQF